MTRIVVLGAGAWGLTLATLLHNKRNQVCVWEKNTALIPELRRTRTCGKPEGLRLPDEVPILESFADAIAQAEVVVGVVPSFGVRTICEQLRSLPGGLGNRTYVNCAKGIEDETLLLPFQIFRDVLGNELDGQYVALSGPSIAAEVLRGIPTVVVSCSSNPEAASFVQELFMLRNFRVYTQSDCIGVELGAALKNVIAIAAGACDGLGFGVNTKSALVTRGLAEIARVGAAMGAEAQTLSGLAGLGDLVTTAMSPHSRNRTFGELIGRGIPAKEALRQVGAVVEGYWTSKSAYDLGRKLDVMMPITGAVHAILWEGRPLHQTWESLLHRDPKPEVY